MKRRHHIDWKPGDLAQCRRSAPWLNPATGAVAKDGPQGGEVCHVRKVFAVPDAHCCGMGLLFDEYVGELVTDAFDSCEFVKIGDGDALAAQRARAKREPEHA